MDNQRRRLPDFLIIGAQRSGTSWLYKNLKLHPEIWLPPVKELHYFDATNAPKKQTQRRFQRKIKRSAFYLARQALTLDKQLFADLSWDIHYFFGKRNDKWYVNLFRPRSGQVAGEATPAYAVLGRDRIKQIREINPDLRLIYIMRDPIDRNWSSATNGLAKRRGRMLSDIPDAEIYEKLDKAGAVARSNHSQVINNWQNEFPSQQLFLGFFEDLVERPRELLLEIYAFLGVTVSDKYLPATLGGKVNAAGKYKTDIPHRFQVHLARQQIGSLTELSKNLGGRTTEWLKKAEALLHAEK